MKFVATLAVTAAMGLAVPAQAQLFYVGVRGGDAVPKGSFEDTQFATQEQCIAGAKQSDVAVSHLDAFGGQSASAEHGARQRPLVVSQFG